MAEDSTDDLSQEIVILEADGDDEEVAKEAIDKEVENNDAKIAENKKKKILIIVIAIISLLLVVLIVVIVIIKTKHIEKPTSIDTTKIVQKLIKKENVSPFSVSKIDKMIQKANLLYERGEKPKALKIFEKIAIYNEALSSYNIGVAKMKEKNYAQAIVSFKKAIQNREQKCISSINAAVSALHLNKSGLFKYYIDLAYAYLPEDANLPLYSYEMSLINYYKKFYYEALSSLEHPSEKFNVDEQRYISSKILAYIGNNKRAIDALLKIDQTYVYFPLGLLYSRIGEFAIAKRYLEKALSFTNEPLKVKIALALVENKLGELTSSADILDEVYKQNEKAAVSTYPIQAILKYSLFDVNIAQKEFQKNLYFDDKNVFGLIFYFAPYKIFNAAQSIEYIRKGSMNLFLNKLAPALDYLKASSSISKVNASIAKGIKKALANHVFQANKIFKALIKDYPSHSILHYNLGLTYAQMGNFKKAYKHFSTSYHLDNTNYLAGVFSIYCAKLIKKDVARLSDDVKSSIAMDKNIPDTNLYMSMINLSENNQFSLSRWIEADKKENPLNLAFDTIIAQKISNEKYFRKKSTQLQAMLPKDLMSNIIYFNMKYTNTDIKEYAKNIQLQFKDKKLDFSSFYYGAKIARRQYIKLLQISGLLYHERDRLKARLPLEKDDPMALTNTLAYLDIFSNNFEESYVLYNKLIDDFELKDSTTIFLAATASIGAKHIENAIALLELSKIIDNTNDESRYALGLLYQEVKNFKGAIIQYKKIKDKNFKSKYFSFKIRRNGV
jgi:tetratricopeptide (TPR) repeat protein